MAKIGTPTAGAQAPAQPAQPGLPYPAPAAVPPPPAAQPAAAAAPPDGYPYQDQATGQWMMNGQPLGPPPAPAPAPPAAFAPAPLPPNAAAQQVLPALDGSNAAASGYANPFGVYGGAGQFAQPQAPPQGGLSGAIGGMSGSGADLLGFNFGGVEDKNFRLLPKVDEQNRPVDYEGRITKVEPGTASSSGNAKLGLTIVTTFPVEHAGVTLSDNVTFEANAAWKLKSLCRATGTLSEDGQRYTGQSATGQDWIDNIVRFRIRHSEWPEGSGDLRNKIEGGYTEGYETPGLPGAPAAPTAPGGALPNFGAR